jgi:hypothetical protein
MPITVTIAKTGVFDEYGRTLAVGAAYTPYNDDYARSLVQTLKATDTNGVMAYPYSAPFQFGGVFDRNGLLIGFQSANGIAALGAPSGTWANKPTLGANERGAYIANDVGANLNGVGGGNVFVWTGTRWKPAGGNIILDAVDSPNTSIANTAEQNLNPNHIVIPAGVIGTNDRLRLKASLSKSSTVDTSTLRVRFGPLGTVADPILTTITSLATTNLTDAFPLDFKAVSATSIQKLGNASTDQSFSGGNAGAYPAAVAVSSMATNPMYLSITSQMTTGVETVTLQDYTLEIYPTDSA